MSITHGTIRTSRHRGLQVSQWRDNQVQRPAASGQRLQCSGNRQATCTIDATVRIRGDKAGSQNNKAPRSANRVGVWAL